MLNVTQPLHHTLLRATGWHSRAVEGLEPSVDDRPTSPPPGLAWVGDAIGLAAALRLPGAAPRLAGAPRGDGHVVIDLPGWKASEATGAPLRAYLRALGYDARSWGLGVNTGDPERDAEILARMVVGIAADHGPVSLVGWSLGGVVAREVAREHPDAVRRLITYGTPVVGGPTFTVGAVAYGVEECARITQVTEDLDQTRPITVPVTTIYTRRDGVVAWQACLDHASLDVEHVEVGSTHLGLGIDPDVWTVIAARLAQPVRTAGSVA